MHQWSLDHAVIQEDNDEKVTWWSIKTETRKLDEENDEYKEEIDENSDKNETSTSSSDYKPDYIGFKFEPNNRIRERHESTQLG